MDFIDFEEYKKIQNEIYKNIFIVIRSRIMGYVSKFFAKDLYEVYLSASGDEDLTNGMTLGEILDIIEKDFKL